MGTVRILCRPSAKLVLLKRFQCPNNRVMYWQDSGDTVYVSKHTLQCNIYPKTVPETIYPFFFFRKKWYTKKPFIRIKNIFTFYCIIRALSTAYKLLLPKLLLFGNLINVFDTQSYLVSKIKYFQYKRNID